MDFEQWYAARYDEWWKKKHAELKEAWKELAAHNVPPDVIARTFDVVSHAIQDQYE